MDKETKERVTIETEETINGNQRVKVIETVETGEIIDMNQAVKLLETTRSTFYRWLRSGKIKGMKVGRQWRFYREDVERFLKGQDVLSQGEQKGMDLL